MTTRFTRFRKRYLVRFLALVPIAAAAIFMLAWTLWMKPQRVAAVQAIEVQTTALRDAGVPFTPKEQHEKHDLPATEENGIEDYQKAFDALEAAGNPGDTDFEILPVVGTYDPIPGQPIPPENFAAMEACLQANAETLVLLRRAARHERVRFPIRFEDGYMAELPHLSPLRSSQRLLRLDALYQALKGNDEIVQQDLDAALNLSFALEGEELVISQLVRSSTIELFLTSLNELLWQIPLKEETLQHTSNKLSRIDGHALLRRSLSMECAMGSQALRQLAAGESDVFFAGNSLNDLAGGAYAGFLRATGSMPGMQAEYLHTMKALIELSAQPWAESKPQWDEWKAQVRGNALTRPLDDVVYVAFPLRDQMQRLDTAVLLARTACALEQYHRKQSALPDSLNALVPDYFETVPQDPYTLNAPLIYRRLDDGYIIYSIYQNLQDDHGAAPAPGFSNGGKQDYVFEVHRPDLAAPQTGTPRPD